MKKILVTYLILAFVGVALCTVVNVPVMHSHAEAATQMVNWQCQRCGQRAWLRSGTLPAQYGCGGDFNQRHIWSRM